MFWEGLPGIACVLSKSERNVGRSGKVAWDCLCTGKEFAVVWGYRAEKWNGREVRE